jgi:hypothetical protein
VDEAAKPGSLVIGVVAKVDKVGGMGRIDDTLIR